MKARIRQIAFALVFIAIGVGIGHFIRINGNTGTVSERHESGYSFIAPLLECNNIASETASTLRPFENRITESVRIIRKTRKVEAISVYFRELNDGWLLKFGDIDSFAPASLLKVPLMIAIFKEAERNPGILKRAVTYRGNNDLSRIQRTKPAKTLTPNQSYSVDELVSRMIVYSDNDAFMVLEGVVSPEVYQKVYRDMGIPMSYFSQQNYQISAVQFASFFRILYNATYLNRELSEKALSLLAQVDFKKGLAAGVPRGVRVADKFGEGSEGSLAELHDCGIIYYPQHPYLLCVMSKGRDSELLDDAIVDLSRAIYEEVAAQYSPDSSAK